MEARERRQRRDRHGRGMRGPLARPPVPIALTRRETFDDLVLDAADRVAAYLAATRDLDIGEIVFAIEDVPTFAPDESPDEIPLGHVEERSATAPPAVVLYRRTIEARAGRGRELDELVRDVVVEHVAELLGLDPEDVDPGYDS